jgi:hypothetical protein
LSSTAEQIKSAAIVSFVTAVVTASLFSFQEQIRSYWEDSIEVSYEYTEILVPKSIADSIPNSTQTDALDELFKQISASNNIDMRFNYEINQYSEIIKSLKLFYNDSKFEKSFVGNDMFSAYNIDIKNATDKTASSLKFPIPTNYALSSNRKNIEISTNSATIKDVLPNEKIKIYIFSIGNAVYDKDITFTANDKKIITKNTSSEKHRPIQYTSFMDIFSTFTIFLAILFLITLVVDSNSALRRKFQSPSVLERMRKDIQFHSKENLSTSHPSDDS